MTQSRCTPGRRRPNGRAGPPGSPPPGSPGSPNPPLGGGPALLEVLAASRGTGRRSASAGRPGPPLGTGAEHDQDLPVRRGRAPGRWTRRSSAHARLAGARPGFTRGSRLRPAIPSFPELIGPPSKPARTAWRSRFSARHGGSPSGTAVRGRAGPGRVSANRRGDRPRRWPGCARMITLDRRPRRLARDAAVPPGQPRGPASGGGRGCRPPRG